MILHLNPTIRYTNPLVIIMIIDSRYMFRFKKYYMLCFILTAYTLGAHVSTEYASEIADKVHSKYNANRTADSVDIKSINTVSENSIDLFYVINLEPSGFILLSADDRAIPILGYSFENNFESWSSSGNRNWTRGRDGDFAYRTCAFLNFFCTNYNFNTNDGNRFALLDARNTNINSSVLTSPSASFSTVGQQNIALSFDHFYFNSRSNGAGYVEYTVNNGQSWQNHNINSWMRIKPK